MRLPDGVYTVGELIPISTQVTGLKPLFNLEAVRVAMNRVYGDLATPVADGDEVAFFRPLQGIIANYLRIATLKVILTGLRQQGLI